MTVTEILTTDRTPPPRRGVPNRFGTGGRLALLVATLALATVAALAVWAHPGHVTSPATPAQQPPAAYLPGGSVYELQVPHPAGPDSPRFLLAREPHAPATSGCR